MWPVGYLSVVSVCICLWVLTAITGGLNLGREFGKKCHILGDTGDRQMDKEECEERWKVEGAARAQKGVL